MLRLLVHDVRNPLTPIVGALELLRLDGARVPAYLERSLDRLGDRLSAYEALRWSPPGETPPGLIRTLLGLPVSGSDRPLPLAPLRLLSALELAAPAAVALEGDAGDCALRVTLTGLSPEAADAGASPRYELLLPRLHSPDEVLGAALVRTVFRDAGARVGPLLDGGPGLVLSL